MALLALTAATATLGGCLRRYLHPEFVRMDGIVYTERREHGLIRDLVMSKKPDGLGVVLLVGGGWKSSPDGFRPWMTAPLLRRR